VGAEKEKGKRGMKEIVGRCHRNALISRHYFDIAWLLLRTFSLPVGTVLYFANPGQLAP
jgi:hypothetical protein